MKKAAQRVRETKTAKSRTPSSTEPSGPHPRTAPVSNEAAVKRDEAARTRRHIQTILRHLSTAPGIYKMLGRDGSVLYVGKAKNLKKRVSSYFQKQQHTPKTVALVAKIRDIQTMTVGSEVEALLLETNLIKEYRPPYNILMRDDKNVAYLRVAKGGDFPRIDVVRNVARDRESLRYIGPYLNAATPLESLEFLKRLFPIRSCRGEITAAGPADAPGQKIRVENRDLGVPRVPCLLLHMKRCSGPCTGAVTPEEYGALLANVERALDGRVDELIAQATTQMAEAASARQYERAGRLRDQIQALERIGALHGQVVTGTALVSQDIVHFALGAGAAAAVLLRVRRGRLIDTQYASFRAHADAEPADVLDAIVTQYYVDAFDPPDEVLIPERTASAEAVEALLTERRKKRVALRVPERGDGARLLQLARENAAQHLEETKLKWEKEESRTTRATAELGAALGAKELHRIECYDISHIQGTSKVGSMVVFLDGAPAKSQYRRFQIKELAEGESDDFASLAEVLRRRLAYLKEEEAAERLRENVEQAPPEEAGGEMSAPGSSPEEAPPDAAAPAESPAEPAAEPKKKPGRKKKLPLPTDDSSFGALPDLLLIDGGKGQLSAVRAVLRELSLEHIPVASLAKKEEELFLPDADDPIRLPAYSEALYLVQRIRDEAHRFAITYHRGVRSKKMVRSRLDEIPGIGPTAKKKLLARFGSVKGIRAATEDELRAVVGAGLALRLKDLL